MQRSLTGKSADLQQVGFSGIEFNGHCAMMVDNHVPSGTIYFLNPGGTQTITPTINLTAAVSTGNDVSFGAYWR